MATQKQVKAINAKINQLEHAATSKMDKWGTAKQREKWVVYEITTGSVLVCWGSITLACDFVLWAWAEGFLLLFGVGLVLLRNLFLALCPLLLRQYKFFTAIVNAVLVFMEVGVDVVITVVDYIMVIINVVIKILNTISSITGHGKLINFSFKLIHWIKIDTLSYSQIKDALTALPPTCLSYNTSAKVMEYFIQFGLHDYTCPLIRYFYPTWLYPMFKFFLGFTIYGSAEPTLFDPNKNCAAQGETGIYTTICASMGLSFVILDVFVAILFIMIIVQNLGAGLLKFGNVAVYFLYVVVEEADDVVLMTMAHLFQ